MPGEWEQVPMALRDMVLGHLQQRRMELLKAMKRHAARNDNQMTARYENMIEAFDAAMRKLGDPCR